MIKAIIFDLDDTLYDEKTFVLSGFRVVAKYLSERYMININDVYNLLIKSLECYGRGKNFDIVLEKLNLYSKELVIKLVEIYRAHNPNISLYPDAKEALYKIKKLSLKLGMITDGDVEVQMNKIKALEIENLFDYIVISDEYGVNKRKPNPYLYKLILNKLSISGSDAIYIGDNPYKDFIGAKKLGILTIRVLRGRYKNTVVNNNYDADYKVRKLQEIFQIINNKNKLKRR